jgi:hypothetical protein
MDGAASAPGGVTVLRGARWEGMAAALSVVAILLLGRAGPAAAEPYLAVREGFTCAGCHVSPTGGGLRNTFGSIYSQQQLPIVPLGDGDVWSGKVFERFGVGANARFAARVFDNDNQDDNLDFVTDRLAVYGSARLNDHVLLYVDQQLAPGGSVNREAWAKIQWNEFYLRAGRLFLPFGWRLVDNSAATRSVTGVTMDRGDDGVELGYSGTRFDAQLSVTNGNGGGSEIDDGKLFSGRAAWVARAFQLGVSGYHNDTDLVDRTMFGVFGGLKTGPIAWLAEYDWIEDKDVPPDDVDVESSVGLVEANWRIARGHNLKATIEVEQFDDDLEDRWRGSLVYEVFPWPFTQLRLGFRKRDSDDPDARLNNEEAFVQLHAYF